MESEARAVAALEPMAWNKTMLGPVLTSREQQSRGLHALHTTQRQFPPHAAMDAGKVSHMAVT
jgi:hypothetical protein